MSFPGFDKAQEEFERRRGMSPEDESEERETRRISREFEEEYVDELRDRQKDDREERSRWNRDHE